MLRRIGGLFAAAVVSIWCLGATPAGAQQGSPAPRSLADLGAEEGYAVSADGVKIHYVTAGEGPLLLLVHGFADFWYSWRHQMPAWSRSHRVVAIDLRGYNRSGQPDGVEHYTLDHLLADLDAVVQHFGRSRTTLVGHDWGGFLAWEYAMRYPRRVSRLVVLNSPHPQAVLREVSKNVDADQIAQARRSLTSDEALLRWTPRRLASWVREPLARQRYIEAFQRSSIEAILNHYKARDADPLRTARYQRPERAMVQCPVLMIHGLEDPRIETASLRDNWQWVDDELTVVTYRRAGHFVHHDRPAAVTQRVLQWLGTFPTGQRVQPEPPDGEPANRATARPVPFHPRRR